MTEFNDFKPFFDAMISKMQSHDHDKGDLWRETKKYVAYNLREKLWEEFIECIEFNETENTRKPEEFVDLANICAMIYLRSSEQKVKQNV